MTTNSYNIYNRLSGSDLGTYEGGSREEALLAMYRDAGYDGSDVWIGEDGDIVVAEHLAEHLAVLLDPTELEVMAKPAPTRLTGHEAIAYAASRGRSLHKYADPIEDARSGLSVDEAREVAREDPALIWLEIHVERYTFGPTPALAWSEGGPLEGFENTGNWPDALTPDIAALISAYGCEPDEAEEFWGLAEEDAFLRHADGRWAIVGLTVTDHSFVAQV